MSSSTNRLSTRIALLSLLLILVGLIGFLPYAAGYADHRKSLFEWLEAGWSEPTWQHGILVFPICLYLIYKRRNELRQLPIQSSIWGLVLSFIACFFFWIGYQGNFYYVGFVSLHLLLIGSILWLFGLQHLKALSFVLVFIAFAWPFLFLEDLVAFKLRFLMVSITEKSLNLMGIPNLQDGTRLVSMATDTMAQGQRFDINVDGPCSGLRSLFALMMVSTLFAYFRQRSLWRRCLLFSLSIPIAVFANALRIIILTLATMLFGSEFALGHGEEYTSNFHLLTGMFLFAVAVICLRSFEGILNKCFGKEKPIKL